MKAFDIYLTNPSTGKFSFDHIRNGKNLADAKEKATNYFQRCGKLTEGREVFVRTTTSAPRGAHRAVNMNNN